jgi:two-component system cell cycle sensor histidine kinase/response regulator CckA
MPGCTGLDVARGVRNINPALPVILVSGFLSRDLVSEAKELGVRLILNKPLSSDELCGAVARALGPSTTPAIGAGG